MLGTQVPPANGRKPSITATLEGTDNGCSKAEVDTLPSCGKAVENRPCAAPSGCEAASSGAAEAAPADDVELVLGFLEKTQKKFRRESFPSKVGGRPVFLYRAAAATPECRSCAAPLRFLVQLYAPVDASHADAFHRTLFLYVCVSPSCARASGGHCVRVLRAQLPRRNDVYPYNAGEAMPMPKGASEIVGKCAVCGGAASSRCAGCAGDAYCGRKCQRTDWRLGHKAVCAARREGRDQEARKQADELRERRRKALFPEFGLETEAWSDGEDEGSGSEEEDADGEAEGDAGMNEAAMRLMAEKDGVKMGTMQDADAEELPEDMFKSRNGKRDPVFERFCRVTREPVDQVLRYARGGECMWAYSEGQFTPGQGQCKECEGEVVFEFEVLPQMLYYLEEEMQQTGGRKEEHERKSIGEIAERLRDGVDWGVIAVFTCKNSCGIGGRYAEETAWLQRAA